MSTAYVGNKGRAAKKGNMGSLGNSGNAMCPFERRRMHISFQSFHFFKLVLGHILKEGWPGWPCDDFDDFDKLDKGWQGPGWPGWPRWPCYDNLDKDGKVSGWQGGKVKKRRKCQCSQSDQTNTYLNNVITFDVRLDSQAVKCKLRNGLISTWHICSKCHDLYLNWMTMSLGEFDRNCVDKFGQVAEKQTVEVEEKRDQGILTSNGKRFSNLGSRFFCHMVCLV